MSLNVAIIPARSGSKGVPDKNILPLSGYPLLAYSILAAKNSKAIDKVFVSTDSKAYADIAIEYGAEVPFLRPKELSTDTSQDIDFLKHFLQWYSETSQDLPDYLVHLRPTTPLRDPKVLDRALKEIKQCLKPVTALRSVHAMPESAYKSFEMASDYLQVLGGETTNVEAANQPRQSFPDTFFANGYVDVLLPRLILDKGLIHGDKVLGFETEIVTEVDTVEDFNYLEYQVSANSLLKAKLFG